jgi:DNA-binding PadR family transcriptional regulator
VAIINGSKMKKKISGERVTSKIIFVNRFYENGPFVFLYGGARNKFDVFRSFLQAGQDENYCSVYAHLEKYGKNKLENYFKGYPDLHCIHLKTSNSTELKEKITDVKSRHIRLILDFNGPYELERFIDLFTLLKKILKNNDVLFSHDVNHLDQEKLEILKEVSKSIVISSRNDSIIFSLFGPTPGREGSSPSFDVISKTRVKDQVKRSFDILILAMLNKKSMCGMDIIKTFVSNFGILPSQGAVYPFLYSLEKKGVVKSRIKSDNKTKVYSLTPHGKKFVKDQIKEYRIIQNRIQDFVNQSL